MIAAGRAPCMRWPTSTTSSLASYSSHVRCRAVAVETRSSSSAASSSTGTSNPRTTSTTPSVPIPPLRTPPPEWDLRAATLARSRRLAGVMAPQLLDLVEEGVLVALQPRKHVQTPEGLTVALPSPDVIFLVGTVHSGSRSPQDVRRVIHALAPDTVMVELCLERTSLLYKNEWGRQQQGQQRQAQAAGVGAGGARQPARDGQGKQQGQQEGPSFGKVLAAQGPARLAEFVDYAYSLLENDLGIETCMEFAAVRQALEELGEGGKLWRYQIILGDVPCEQTSRSVWRAMTRASWARLAGKVLARASALLWQAAGSVDKLREEVVRQSDTSDGSWFELVQGAMYEVPELMRPYLHDRDAYMARMLAFPPGSHTSFEPQCVVAVMGKAHVRGVAYSIEQDLREGARQVEQHGPDSFLDMLRRQAQVQEEQQEVHEQQGQQQEWPWAGLQGQLQALQGQQQKQQQGQQQRQRQWWDLGPELAPLLASVLRDPLMTVPPPGADDL